MNWVSFSLAFMKARPLCLYAMVLGGLGRAESQQIDSIYFHLYTDSLKKGVHNYINVDGKLSDGRWLPLTPREIILESNAGHFEGNDLILAPDFPSDRVTVKATLRQNPAITKQVTIWLKKLPDQLPADSSPEDQPYKRGRKSRPGKTAGKLSMKQNLSLSLRRQVLHDQLPLNLPRAGRQQG